MTDEAKLSLALEDLISKRFSSVRKAAAYHAVPRSTLGARYKGRQTRQEARADQQALSPAQEKVLAQWCLDLEALAQAPNHAQIREMAILILRNNGNPSHLGKNWVPHFIRRNPQVKTKQGRALDRKRTQWLYRSHVDKWFQDLAAIVKRKGINPCNYWNMDEIGTALGPCSNQLVVGSSSTTSSLVKTTINREWCTAIEAVNPFGQALTPLLIFKAKHVQNQWFIPSETPDWIYSSSQAAFTTNEIGLKWLQEIFIPQTQQNLGKNDWRLLLLDGHKSHTTPEFMRLAYLHNIWCFYLLPHASHALQPLDISVFSPLKRAFRALVAFENQFDDHEPQKKAVFLQQYQQARKHAIRESTCKSGFKSAGIEPLNPQKVLSSSWILEDPPQTPTKPRTPPRSVSQLTWDPTTTPKGRKDISLAVQSLSREATLSRSVRMVLKKSSLALERANIHNALYQREIRVQKCTIDRLKKKKKKQEPVNPNKLFITLNDIEAGPVALERPVQVNVKPTAACPNAQTLGTETAVPLDPFLAITSRIQAIQYS
jgi:hypothetical protein